MCDNKLHIAMYPWFAMGHLTSFIHLSNKLAEREHKISFFLPTKTQTMLKSFNLHPDLIAFIPVDVPCVDGLPPGTETTADIPFALQPLLMTAMDLTRSAIEESLSNLKPHFVFFDFTYWIPKLVRSLGIRSIHYCTISPAAVGYLISPERKLHDNPLTGAALMKPPTSFPQSSIKLLSHEARGLAAGTLREYGSQKTFMERQLTSFKDCDAIAFRTSREMEGLYCNYLETQLGKPVILAGPVVPESPSSKLEEKWRHLLDNFKPRTVIFCAFGSECRLSKDQFQELVLGFELTGLPFFAALKPPIGFESIESALPEGYIDKIHGRGTIYGSWVQQQLILRHPSVGCFVTHCGSGSMLEGMVNECQLVLMPHVGDQIFNARIMSGDLKVGVEVEEGDEDGLFNKEGVCRAVKTVMDDDSEIGEEVRANHAKWREFLLSPGLESSYIDGFVEKLHALLC